MEIFKGALNGCHWHSFNLLSDIFCTDFLRDPQSDALVACHDEDRIIIPIEQDPNSVIGKYIHGRTSHLEEAITVYVWCWVCLGKTCQNMFLQEMHVVMKSVTQWYPGNKSQKKLLENGVRIKIWVVDIEIMMVLFSIGQNLSVEWIHLALMMVNYLKLLKTVPLKTNNIAT